MSKNFYADWKEKVVLSDDGPQPTVLFEDQQIKVIVAGLTAGQKIPSHSEGYGVYHFLEGEGWMQINQERHAVSAGSTVIAVKGDIRGIEASTNLYFLATRVSQPE